MSYRWLLFGCVVALYATSVLAARSSIPIISRDASSTASYDAPASPAEKTFSAEDLTQSDRAESDSGLADRADENDFMPSEDQSERDGEGEGDQAEEQREDSEDFDREDVGSNARFKEEGATKPSSQEPLWTYVPATAGYQAPCDMTAERGICLFGGQKVLLPDATQKGLVAKYSFDEAHPMDSSRLQNHGVAVVPPGPGRGGFGTSARFTGETWFEVPTSESIAALGKEITMTAWVYFERTSSTSDFDCPIIYLGQPAPRNVFALNYKSLTGELSATRMNDYQTLRSRSRPRRHQWHHVALVMSKTSFSMYVDGVLDTSATVDAVAKPFPEAVKNANLFAGGVPWNTGPECAFPVLLDDLNLYNRALRAEEIEAESFPALGAIEPSFARLGNTDLTFADATQACSAPYHLCTKNDLEAGAVHVARKLGWPAPYWENDAIGGAKHSGDPSERKTAICCM